MKRKKILNMDSSSANVENQQTGTASMEYTSLESSPMLTKLNDMDILMEDSIDGPPSVGSGEHPVAISTPSTSTPATAKKQKIKYKLVSGYILYSRAHRKGVVANNPDSNFGDISRIVGNEWRSLSASEKAPWEEKATKMNEEIKLRGEAVTTTSEETCTSPAPVHPDQIYECYWDQCDYQFEELIDCLEHCIKEKDGVAGHVQSYFQQNPDAEMHCLWRGCQRIKNKKNSQPFPNVQRLVRHVKDLHINKGNGRVVAPENRNKNFKPSSRGNAIAMRPTPTATPTPSSASSSVPTPVAPPTPAPKQLEPLFISVPPRPQRALHSEAYIKYIEGLHAENKYICNWERTLNGSQETAPAPDPEKLNSVATWLGPKANQQDNVLNALWTLRNQLLRDTLSLQKTL